MALIYLSDTDFSWEVIEMEIKAVSISEKHQKILNNLKSSSLAEIYMDPTTLSLRLNFTYGPDGKDISIVFFHIAHMTISKILDDEDGVFNISEISINGIKDGGSDLLKKLGYMFQDGNGVLTYPEEKLFHLYIEGDVCMEVICGNYKILQEIK